MQKILVVVDMQNDFIDGALKNEQALAIVPAVKAKIEGFDGRIIFTRDTHEENYLTTQEGRNLPVEHCIKGSEGWQINSVLAPFCNEVFDKPAFGSVELAKALCETNSAEGIESITFIGVCTDICVISNAMLAKAFMPEVPVIVDAACCAGVTPESHNTALNAMRTCQIKIENA